MHRSLEAFGITWLLLVVRVAFVSSDTHLLQVDEALDANVTKIIWPGPFDDQASVGGIQEAGVLLSTDFEMTDTGVAQLDITGDDGMLQPEEWAVFTNGTHEPYYMVQPPAITSTAAPGSTGTPDADTDKVEQEKQEDPTIEIQSGTDEPVYVGDSNITITDKAESWKAPGQPDVIMSPTHEPIYNSAPPRLPSTVAISDLLAPTAADLLNQGEPSTAGAYGEEDAVSLTSATEQYAGALHDFQQYAAPAVLPSSSTVKQYTAPASTVGDVTPLQLATTTTSTPTPTVMVASVEDEKSADSIASSSWSIAALLVAALAAAL